jgi:phosphonate transport system substrate-binding protein
MRKICHKKIILGMGLFAFCLAGTPATANELRIGTVTEFPDRHFPQFQALADYLQKNLQGTGVERVKIILPGSLRSMGYLLDQGKIDLIFDSPLNMTAIEQFSDLNYLLRQWKGGQLEYHTVLFTKKDAPYTKVGDLKAMAIAMEDPYSSSGYWIPKYFLTEQGLQFVRVFRPTQKLPPGKTGYAFTYSDDLALKWVERGLIKAGVVNNLVFEKEAPKFLDLKVLYQSPNFYQQLVAYRPDLEPGLREKIRQVLKTMDQDPEGQRVLVTFYQTTRFDEFPQGPEAYKNSLKVFAPFLKKELGLH